MKYKFNVDVSVKLNPEEIVYNLDRDELLEFIKQLDIAVHDVDFTEKLIILLINSLKCDLSEDEWMPYKQLLTKLENV